MVSVIVPTYRRDGMLKRALDSLCTQTYKDIEVVVVDDNADKNWNATVKKIVDGFFGKLNITYIVNETTKGSAETRNIGIKNANGEYIAFLDDDDVYLPKRIKNQLDVVESVGADYSITNLLLYDENEKLRETRIRKYLKTREAENLYVCHLKYHMTGTDTMMFKADYLRSFGGFDPIDVGDEYYLMMKAIEHNGRFVYCDFCDVKAYIHTGDIGLSAGQGKINGENNLYKYKKEHFNGLSLKDKRYISMRHFAVLAFAYKKMGNKIKFFTNGIHAFLISPIQSAKLIADMFVK